MDLNQFIENFANQFDNTDAAEFKAGTVFKDLDDWSSFIAVSIVATVYEEYGVTLDGDDIRNANTIEDLYTIIEERIK